MAGGPPLEGTSETFAILGPAGPPSVSVIIPVRNAEADLALQLSALASEPLDDVEIIVVDNGSTDGTRALAHSYRSRMPCLRIIDAGTNPGQPYALNRGVEVALGQILLFLDADDEIAPGYLTAMRAALEKHEFVAARMDLVALNPAWVRATRPADQQDGLGTPFGHDPAAATCTLGVRRSVIDRVGPFDETLPVCQDIDFAWRAHGLGIELHFAPEAVLRYRYRTSLRGIFRQAKGYGAAGPLLYKRYRKSGMPRRGWRSVVRFWGGLAPRALRIRNRTDLAAWLFLAGYRFGLLRGCLTARVLYL